MSNPSVKILVTGGTFDKEYNELDGGEHQGGHHACLLEAFVMEDDVVDHFERNDR